MRKIGWGFLAVLPIAGVAMAADLPSQTPVAAYDWNGLYAGVHVGQGWGKTIVTHETGTPVFPTGFSWPHKFDGAVGGGQLGFNWKFNPNFLIGIEGDFSTSGIKGRTSEPSPTVPGTASV